MLNKVRILQSVNKPSIINLEDVIDNFLFNVLELAEGGDLFKEIIKKMKLNEAEAKLHFIHTNSAIKYLHFKKIFHSDLKSENNQLCLVDKSLPIMKITDMGLSKLVDKIRLTKKSTAMPLSA